MSKKPPTPPEVAQSPQRRESLARSEDIPTPLGVTASEPPRSEHSFTSDEIPVEMAEKEAHYEVSAESPIAETEVRKIVLIFCFILFYLIILTFSNTERQWKEIVRKVTKFLLR